VKTATNKRLLISESHGDSNWCTPCRGSLIHMTHTLFTLVHVRHSYASCGQSPYVTTFGTESTELDGCTALEKMCSWLHLSTRLSGPRDPPQFLSLHNHWSSVLKSSIYWRTGYIGLLCPYLQHVISMFNTWSRGSTYRSLTDTGRDYNLEGAGFRHHSPRPSQPTVLRFPLRAPPGLRLTIQPNPTKPRRSNPNLMSGTPPLDFYHSLSSKHSNY
jgi:hypothetical protein